MNSCCGPSAAAGLLQGSAVVNVAQFCCGPASGSAVVNVAQCRRRDREELEDLLGGHLTCENGGLHARVRVNILLLEDHICKRLLSDMVTLRRVLEMLSDEERFWVELEDPRTTVVDPILSVFGTPPRSEIEARVEHELQQLWGTHFEDHRARRVKSSVVFGWCVPAGERIFSSFILSHESCLKNMAAASVQLSTRALRLYSPLDFVAAEVGGVGRGGREAGLVVERSKTL